MREALSSAILRSIARYRLMTHAGTFVSAVFCGNRKLNFVANFLSKVFLLNRHKGFFPSALLYFFIACLAAVVYRN